MTELEALNMLLRLIGSSPVNDPASPHPDAANARTTLNRLRKQQQTRGWWFNIDYNILYQPDENGKIRIPDEIDTFIAEDANNIVRGKYLYNKYNNSFVFTGNITAHRTVRILEWDDMPSAMQRHCGYFAGAQFIRDEVEDPGKQKELEQSAMQELIAVKKQDLEEGRYNIFNSTRARAARSRVTPYNRRGRT